MKGFVNIFKPVNMTSSDVVVKVRGILRRATGEKHKVGHLGTLDPLAIGVLPIAIGKATRLFDYMQEKKKVYYATFKFGETTDTLDCGSQITQRVEKQISFAEVLNVIDKLIGEVEQMPPQYSAKSVGGRRAYDIARKGGIAELSPKKVNIYNLELLDIASIDANSTLALPSRALAANEYAFKITCGSGTYIRSIARDMATLLGTVGYMTSLCRTQSGDFLAQDAINFDEFEKNPLSFITPIDYALQDFDKINLDAQLGARALNGIRITCNQNVKSPFVVSVCDEIVGMGKITDGKLNLVTRL